MSLILIPAIVILGWIAGVVINHAANALPAKETLFQVPFYRISHCPKPPRAWSAILAYLTGTKHCPQTGHSIGLRHLVVETVTPALFLFLYFLYPLSVYLFFVLAYTAILVLLTVTDLEHRLIQNVIILPAILIAILGSFFTPNFSWQRAILGGAIGFIVFYVLALLARGGLGSGDVTLSAFLGLITGVPNVLLVIVFGIFLGGLVSAALLVTRRVTLKTFIPYGPFLIVAGWIVLIWGDQIYAGL